MNCAFRFSSSTLKNFSDTPPPQISQANSPFNKNNIQVPEEYKINARGCITVAPKYIWISHLPIFLLSLSLKDMLSLVDGLRSYGDVGPGGLICWLGPEDEPDLVLRCFCLHSSSLSHLISSRFSLATFNKACTHQLVHICWIPVSTLDEKNKTRRWKIRSPCLLASSGKVFAYFWLSLARQRP